MHIRGFMKHRWNFLFRFSASSQTDVATLYNYPIVWKPLTPETRLLPSTAGKSESLSISTGKQSWGRQLWKGVWMLWEEIYLNHHFNCVRPLPHPQPRGTRAGLETLTECTHTGFPHQPVALVQLDHFILQFFRVVWCKAELTDVVIPTLVGIVVPEFWLHRVGAQQGKSHEGTGQPSGDNVISQL